VLDRADAELARTYARLDAAPELLRTAAERAELDATLGLPDRARQRLEQALARHPLAPMAALDRPYAALAAAWAAAGRPDRAEVLLAQWADDVAKEHQPLDARAVLRARIVTRLAQGRASDAERLAREGHFGACAGCADLYLARAFDARGSTDSTIAAYERYLAATSEREQLDARELARAYRRLGELYDARADGARALRSVGDFVTLWQHADPALQPAVDAARQRIRRP
jgi:tetratricopeptide (TPR) repeat protein